MSPGTTTDSSRDGGRARRRGRTRLTRRIALAAAIAVIGAVAVAALGLPSRGGDTDDEVAGVVAARDENAAALGGRASEADIVPADILQDDAPMARAFAVVRRQTDGGPTRSLVSAPDVGALEFPPGVSYPTAVTQLYMGVATGKGIRGARLVASLPRGTVAIVPPPGTGQVTIDLRAPFAYDPGQGGGRIYPASIALEAGPEDTPSLPRSAGGWPRGALVGIPILPPCMRIGARDEPARPACAGGELAVQDLGLLRGAAATVNRQRVSRAG